MTTAKEDVITTPVDEVEVEAEAERLFAEAVDAREGKPAEKADDADESSTAETQGKEEVEAGTAGEGAPGEVQEGQPGGGEGAAAEKAAASGEGDIWANAAPEARAAFEEAAKRAEKAEQQFKSREGREAAFQRRIVELERQLGDGGTKEPRKPLKELLSEDTVKDLTRDYPDLVPVLDTLKEAVSRIDGAEQQLGDVKPAIVAAASAAEEKALNAAVPNWLDLAKDERFLGWVEDQPRKVREAVSANWQAITDAEAAAEVFSSFAEHIKPAEAKPAETESGGKSGKRDRQQQGARPAQVSAPTSAGGESDDEDVAWNQAATKVDRRRGLR